MYVFCSLFLVSHIDVIEILYFVYVFELSERDPVNLRCTEVLSDEKPNSFNQAHFSK